MLSGELAQRACLVKRGLLNPPLARHGCCSLPGELAQNDEAGQGGLLNPPSACHGSLAYTDSGRVGLGLGLVDRASSIPHLAAAPPPMTRHFEEAYF